MIFKNRRHVWLASLLCAGIAFLPVPAAAQTEDPGVALSRHMQTLVQNPLDANALIGAGEAALELGDAQAAATFFARAEEVRPRDGRVKAGLGAAFVQLQQPQAALSFFDEAVRLGTPEYEIGKDRGLAYDITGDPRRAQRDYRLALQHGEDDEVRRRLALSLAISGDRAGALAAIDAQLQRRERAAWRTRAFVLALTGDAVGADQAAASVMSPQQAEALRPFFASLPSLGPAQRAMAVHFGEFPTTGSGTQIASNFGTGSAASIPLAADEAGRLETQPGTLAPRTPPQPAPSTAPRRRPGAEASAVAPVATPPPAAPSRASSLASSPASVPAAPRPTSTAAASPFVPTSGAPDRATVSNAPLPSPEVAGPPAPEAVQPRPIVEAALPPSSTPPLPAAPQQPAAETTRLAGLGAVIARLSDAQVPPPPITPAPAVQAAAESKAEAAKKVAADKKAEADKKAAAEKAAAAKKAAAEKAAAKKVVPSRYWVQIAGGANKASLPREFKRLQEKAPKLLGSRAAYTVPLNATNRLLVGPFKNQAEAQEFVNQLAKSDLTAFSWTSPEGQEIAKLAGK